MDGQVNAAADVTGTATQVAASTYVTATAVTQAAITSLASKAAVSLINNGGKLGKGDATLY